MERAGNKKLATGLIRIPVAASTKLLPGTMAAVNASGYAVAASAAENLKVAGCVQALADNSAGAAGDISVMVDRGTYVWNGDSTITAASVLKLCYVKDATTVTLTPTGSSPVGIIVDVDSDGVTVEMMPAAVLAAVPAAETVADATTTTAGKVKMAANQAASTASDAAGAVADLNTLLGKLKTAGLMAADA